MTEPNERVPGVTMDPSARLKSQNLEGFVVGKRLTDRAIEKYVKAGYYSAQAVSDRKEYRQKLASMRNTRRERTVGDNFVLGEDGRLIYSPM